ncbi:FGGY-family carbohydrate kinase [Halarsenatibacter silvermanii]|uniref:Xylulokinase n=1 Tax=Halarsenatibacter silvermanii TaxID=321763 RepID=A0A1G9LZV5_9FIRM|nr:FGGY-family carbohydrate kinase [Halarsenatibacter silvermanii]SDL67424.1 xylulokinase [Halarsenatibacter silvermanii]
MSHVIGVDIGTQGTKAVLLSESGEVLAHSYSGYEVNTPRPSWAEQWPNVWVEAVKETISEVKAISGVDKESVKGIGISSLYGGAGVPVDENLEPVFPCLIWMDRRAEDEVDWVKNNVDLDKLFDITGNHVNSYFGFTKMLWIKNNKKEIWDEIEYFIPPANYAIHELTGELAVDYSSAGNIGGVFDLKKREWSEEMMNDLGIPSDMMLPRLVSCTDVVGKLTDETAEELGLSPNTAVVAGGIDAPVANVGAGAFAEGSHVAMTGTSMCWGLITRQRNLSPKLVSMPYSLESEEKIYTFGGSSTAGVLARWFRDEFARLEKDVGAKLDLEAYDLLEMKAKDIPPGSEGLLVLPYFMGERSPIWDSNARGTIVGLSLYHSREHLYRAFFEGVAYALKHNVELVEKTEAELDEEIIISGGVTQSELWPQIFADVTGYPVKIIKDDVEAPLGDALLAGLATDVFDSPEVIEDWLEFKPAIEPSEENYEIYDEYFEQYLDIYQNIKGNMEQLTELP